ncbi:galactokinase [Pelagibacteraceae bacterium]|nr:galactokinase [Pelagibacteraceae bacterium]
MKREISSSANGRVNLLGEHLDYNGGAVLPLQIDKCVKIYLSDNNTNEKIVIKSKQYDEKIIINHNLAKQENWSDFVIGACKIISDKFGIKISSINFVIDSDLPIGIGLSSSAAITVATLRALITKYNIEISNEELVSLALRVESDFVNVGGGMMDQFTSIYGSTSEILYLDTATNDFELITLNENYKFLIIDSGESRILANSEFNSRKILCENVANKLSLNYLCELSDLDEKLTKKLTMEEIKIAKHVVYENIRVHKGKKSLLSNNYDLFGKLMTESHMSLKNNYEVSTAKLDTLVNLCNSFGALGSKLTGAGFGGAIVSLIKNDLVDDLKKYIIKNYPNAKFL